MCPLPIDEISRSSSLSITYRGTFSIFRRSFYATTVVLMGQRASQVAQVTLGIDITYYFWRKKAQSRHFENAIPSSFGGSGPQPSDPPPGRAAGSTYLSP